MDQLLLGALDTAKVKGADYADIRSVETSQERIVVRNGVVETITKADSIGFGIRVLFNGACGFAFGDGRAEIKKWIDKRTKVPASFDGRRGMQLNVASPNNPDVAWMQDRSSARKR